MPLRSNSNSQNRVLGVLGGMGPSATLNFMRAVIDITQAKCDQDHLETIVYNDSKIPDRKQAILESGESPLPRLCRNAKKLESIGADILAMPCNTAHFYYEEIQNSVSIPLLHIIRETKKELKKRNASSVGLLATTAVMEVGVYRNELESLGVEICYPKNCSNVMNAIHGVKEGKYNKARQELKKTIHHFETKQLDVIVVGCTDISVLSFESVLPTFDATNILAKASVESVQKRNTEEA